MKDFSVIIETDKLVVVCVPVVDDGTKQPFVTEDVNFSLGIMYSMQRLHT